MRVASEHLIKLSVLADTYPHAEWWRSVCEARNPIEDVVRDSPSLRRELPAMFKDVWPQAERLAILGLRTPEEQRRSASLRGRLGLDQVLTIKDEALPRLPE